MSTLDDAIDGGISGLRQDEARSELASLRAVVAALPKCEGGSYQGKIGYGRKWIPCPNVATHYNGDEGFRCDVHGAGLGWEELPYAKALRELTK